MMKVISLTGYPRVGKNLLVDIVRSLRPGLRIKELAYADKLKELHMQELGIESLVEYNNLLHNGIEYNNLNIRDDMSRLSILCKNKDIQYFVKELDTKLRSLVDTDIVFITDMRYAEEYAYSLSNDHVIIKITRPSAPSCDITKPWNEMITTFTVDYTIHNNNTIEGYTDAVENITLLYLD